MHVLLRGDRLQRLRLASGLVLFAFATTHFLNHATGLISLDLMHQVEALRTTITRSLPGTVILGAALVTHVVLGVYKLAMRRTWRLPLWETMQILVALCIPFLLFPHIVNTRIAHAVFGVNDIYLYELVRLWPDRGVLQSLLLLLVWTHGCIGLHYWLRLADWYDDVKLVLWAVAALVPVLALAGFVVAGTTTADIMSDPTSLAALKQRSNWPNAADSDTMARMRDLTQYAFGAVIAVVAAIFLFRRWRQCRTITVAYHDGPTVTVRRGMTLLEISRAAGVPHASVCGGRARCFTCRVKVDRDLENLPRPNSAEAAALRAMEAPLDIRLACQLRPVAPISVTILNRPAVPGPVQVEFAEIKTVVSAHARAVLAREMTDITSDDPLVITRWFGRWIGYPIAVPDLAASRFLLRGARIDKVVGEKTAALALEHEGHDVSLYMLPGSDTEALRGNRSGYSVLGWQSAGVAYVAVGDLAREVLETLQNAVGADEIDPPEVIRDGAEPAASLRVLFADARSP
jgi:ferredoxin